MCALSSALAPAFKPGCAILFVPGQAASAAFLFGFNLRAPEPARNAKYLFEGLKPVWEGRSSGLIITRRDRAPRLESRG